MLVEFAALFRSSFGVVLLFSQACPAPFGEETYASAALNDAGVCSMMRWNVTTRA